MAIKTCAVTAAATGEGVTLPLETVTITAADTVTITGGSDADKLLLVLNNTAAATKKITIKAGANPPALRKGLGDVVITLLEKTTQVVPIESARHANADGTVSITFESGTTGFVGAVRIPRGL